MTADYWAAILSSACCLGLIVYAYDCEAFPDTDTAIICMQSPPSMHSAPVLQEPTIPGVDPTAPALPSREWMVVTALVTAYQPDVDCATNALGQPTHLTSTRVSTDTKPHGIAADPWLLPYGTAVSVPEYMETTFPDRAWQVDDTGGALRRDRRDNFIVHLDLRYRTVVSALKKGRQWMEIHVDVTDWSPAQRERLRRAAVAGQRMKERGEKP